MRTKKIQPRLTHDKSLSKHFVGKTIQLSDRLHIWDPQEIDDFDLLDFGFEIGILAERLGFAVFYCDLDGEDITFVLAKSRGEAARFVKALPDVGKNDAPKLIQEMEAFQLQYKFSVSQNMESVGRSSGCNIRIERVEGQYYYLVSSGEPLPDSVIRHWRVLQTQIVKVDL